MSATKDKIIIGRFGSVYGIKGWIKVNSFTDPSNNILNYTRWQSVSGNHCQELAVESCKAHGRGFIAKIAGFDTPEDARALTNIDIVIDKSELPKLEAGEYYWSDLIDLQVYTLDNQLLGKVDHLVATGSNDVLVVKGKRQHLVPYNKNIIKSIELNNKRIVVDWDPEF